MRVIVEVISGPAASRRVSLVAGQAVRVGRTDWADVSFPRDQLMSGTHFLLETDATGCYITDQGSRNGTFVNGRRIDQKTPLRDGDRIVAGQTRFAVRVEGQGAVVGIPPVVSAPTPIVSPPVVPPVVAPLGPPVISSGPQSEVFPVDPESSTLRPAPEAGGRRSSYPPEPKAIRPVPAPPVAPASPPSPAGQSAGGPPPAARVPSAPARGPAVPPPARPAAGPMPPDWQLPPELRDLAKSFFAPPQPPPRTRATYTMERCESGLMLYRGNIEEISPADLAVRLTQFCPVYLLMDFNHMGTPPPPELRTRDYVFAWLEPAAVAGVSPLVIAQDDLPDWHKLVDQAWGNDAVVCLFSKMQKGPVVEHVQAACRVRERGGEPSAAVVGCCWPSVLAPMLSHSQPSAVQHLMAGIEGVLVELPDLPDTWQLYGSGDLKQYLDRAGLVGRAQSG